MDETTVQHLNAINREFYRITADAFDATRSDPWDGWSLLLSGLRPLLDYPRVAVLDAGCGNGRFGVFLAAHVTGQVDYHGIDSSPALLEHARQALAVIPGVRATFEERDLMAAPLDAAPCDLVALFGVLHHIPGAGQRRALMQALAACVRPGGFLAFTCWRFTEFERYRQRFVPFPPELQVEPGDHLLDWRRGQPALRYCHDVDAAERAALIAATGMTEIAAFRSDGEGNRANQYSLLEKEPRNENREPS